MHGTAAECGTIMRGRKVAVGEGKGKREIVNL
jgi:hypothetical protein